MRIACAAVVLSALVACTCGASNARDGSQSAPKSAAVSPKSPCGATDTSFTTVPLPRVVDSGQPRVYEPPPADHAATIDPAPLSRVNGAGPSQGVLATLTWPGVYDHRLVWLIVTHNSPVPVYGVAADPPYSCEDFFWIFDAVTGQKLDGVGGLSVP